MPKDSVGMELENLTEEEWRKKPLHFHEALRQGQSSDVGLEPVGEVLLRVHAATMC